MQAREIIMSLPLPGVLWTASVHFLMKLETMFECSKHAAKSLIMQNQVSWGISYKTARWWRYLSPRL